MGKGGGPSGYYYLKQKETIKTAFQPRDPVGFFGAEDAAADQAGTNAFLAAGGRSSLSLGYLTLDPAKMIEFLEDSWRMDNTLCTFIIHSFEKVIENGDLPAYQIRLGGSPMRLDFLHGLHNYRDGLLQSDKKMAYRLERRIRAHLQQGLAHISTGELPRTRKEFIIRYQTLHTHQYRALQQLPHELLQGLTLGALGPKDCDVSLVLWDFERSSDDYTNQFDNLWDNVYHAFECYEMLADKYIWNRSLSAQ